MSKFTAAKARRSLALGYATPIIGGAIAIIFGLMVYDLTRTMLDVWTWVVIQLILGSSLLVGTRMSTKAHLFAEATGKRVGTTKGGRNLSFILGIIWSVVVAMMAVSYGAGASEKLKHWPTDLVGEAAKNPKPTIDAVTVDFVLREYLPAFVLLVIGVFGTYYLLVERARESLSAEVVASKPAVALDKFVAPAQVAAAAKVAAKPVANVTPKAAVKPAAKAAPKLAAKAPAKPAAKPAAKLAAKPAAEPAAKPAPKKK